MKAGAWDLRETVLDGGAVVYAIGTGPADRAGMSVLGWVELLGDGSWRRWPPDGGAPAFHDAEQAVLDVLEYTAHQNAETGGPGWV